MTTTEQKIAALRMAHIDIPKCKAPPPSEGRAYCGDTCTCGYKEVKRRIVVQTLRAQIQAVRNRWGEESVQEALEP